MDPEKLSEKLFEGSVQCIVATPFRESDQEIDFYGLRENIRFLIDKCEGKPLVLTPCGSTSEFYTLSPEERGKVLKTVVDEVNGKFLVIAGAAHSGTKRTVEMCRMAEDVGADGVMVVMPYYHVPNEEGMYQHYKAIAENLNIGVQVYNNPFTSKCYIKPALMNRIVDIHGIAAVKENTINLETFSSHMQLAGKKVPILCGMGEFYFALEALFGCPGFISSVANYAPEVSLELLYAARKKNFGKMMETIERLRPLREFHGKIAAAHAPACTETGGPDTYMYIGIMKEAMNLMGLNGGVPRLPLLSISKAEKRELDEILKKIGVK